MSYSEIIEEIMVLNNYSQEQLAKRLQVNQTTIGQWLHGKKKPSYDNILAIYKEFGVTPNELFGIEK